MKPNRYKVGAALAPLPRLSVPPSHSSFKPKVSLWAYVDEAVAVASPELGNTLFSLLQILNEDKPVFFNTLNYDHNKINITER